MAKSLRSSRAQASRKLRRANLHGPHEELRQQRLALLNDPSTMAKVMTDKERKEEILERKRLRKMQRNGNDVQDQEANDIEMKIEQDNDEETELEDDVKKESKRKQIFLSSQIIFADYDLTIDRSVRNDVYPTKQIEEVDMKEFPSKTIPKKSKSAPLKKKAQKKRKFVWK
jgi:hypothetical protein